MTFVFKLYSTQKLNFLLYLHSMNTRKILVIGAKGQIGAVLTDKLKTFHGAENVIASDINGTANEGIVPLDVLDANQLQEIINTHQITEIYHLAAILSAKGEQSPKAAWNINMNGLLNVLEAARRGSIKRIFFPSTIAVFGDYLPKENISQFANLNPQTVYGISKVAGELCCDYYHKKLGIDIRSLRYPGVIGYQTMPGGGTTDYAVDIYHKAVLGEKFTCFLSKDTRLPMIYMDDAIDATLQLMNAPESEIKYRGGYNIQGMSFSPEEIYESIKKYIPNFEIEYVPDFRQEIAASWPGSLDDSKAREDWHWKPKFDLDSMTQDMIKQLRLKYS